MPKQDKMIPFQVILPIFRKNSASKYDLYEQNFKYESASGSVSTTWNYLVHLGRITPLSTNEISQVSPVLYRMIMRSMLNTSVLFTKWPIEEDGKAFDPKLDGVISLYSGNLLIAKQGALSGTSYAWFGKILDTVKNFGSDQNDRRTINFTESDTYSNISTIQTDLASFKKGDFTAKTDWEKAAAENDLRFILSELQMSTLGFVSAWYECFTISNSFGSFLALATFFANLLQLHDLPKFFNYDLAVSDDESISFDTLQDLITLNKMKEACSAPIMSVGDVATAKREFAGFTNKDMTPSELFQSLAEYLRNNNLKVDTLLGSKLDIGFSKGFGSLYDTLKDADNIIDQKKNYVSMVNLLRDQDATFLSNSCLLIGAMLFKNKRAGVRFDAVQKFVHKYGFLKSLASFSSQTHQTSENIASYNKALRFLFDPSVGYQTKKQQFKRDALNLLKMLMDDTYDSITTDCSSSYEKMEKEYKQGVLPSINYISKDVQHNNLPILGFLKIGQNSIGTRQQDSFNANKDIPFFRDKVYLMVFNDPYLRVWFGSSNNILEDNMHIVFQNKSRDQIGQYLLGSPEALNTLNPSDIQKLNVLYSQRSRYAYSIRDAERVFDQLPDIIKNNYGNVFDLVLNVSDILERAEIQASSSKDKTSIQKTKTNLKSSLDQSTKQIMNLYDTYPTMLDAYENSIKSLKFYIGMRQALEELIETKSRDPKIDVTANKVELQALESKIFALELSISDQHRQLSFCYEILDKCNLLKRDPNKYKEASQMPLQGTATLGVVALTATEIVTIALIIAQAIFYLASAFAIVYGVLKAVDYFCASNLDILIEDYKKALELAKNNCDLAAKNPNNEYYKKLCDSSTHIVTSLENPIKVAAEKEAVAVTPKEAVSQGIKIVSYAVGSAVILYTLGKIYKDIKQVKKDKKSSQALTVDQQSN